ncbi:MAG: AAA family ATPase [Lachnospiraceae bacterium]|nr:AAA family ATPase [Lachnospiraceae bacterium]
MHLKDIHISGFGKYSHKDMSFSEGINIIYGENGSGKSTLHAYLKSMLFGMERGRGRAAGHDSYSRYYPWEGQASYGGSLTLHTEGNDYRIERCLDTKNRSLSVRKGESGQIIATEQEELMPILGHVSEEIYQNTISIEQLKAATDSSLSESLKNRLSSIALSGASTLDVTKALSSLKEQKKALKQQIDGNASHRYHEILAKISDIEVTIKETGTPSENRKGQVEELEKRLEAENCMRRKLEQEIETTRKAIDEHSLSAVGDVDLYQERLHDAYDAYRMASGERGKGKPRSPKVRDVLCGVFAALVFLTLALGSLFYEELPFTNTPFPLPRLPFLILFFIGVGSSFLFTILLFVRSRKEDSASLAMAAETEQFIQNAYKAHLGSSEVTESARIAMKEKFAEYQNLLDTRKKNQNLLEESLTTTAALQEGLQAAMDEKNRLQKGVWEFEQACKELTELEEEKQALSRLMEYNEVLEEKIKAVTLAEETISSLSSKIHETFSPLLNRQVSTIMSAITDGVYDRFHIDENLAVTMRNGGRSVSLDSLSRGTMEQVYLALRLSAVKILFPGQSLPILLDDTFAYYDDTRLNNTLKYLAESYHGQIFLFTSHKREAAFLSRMNVPYQLLVLSGK